MIQYKLLKYSPPLLRWYRLGFTLDWQHMLQYLPQQGTLLDVGCGVGTLDYAIAKSNPALHVIGIDINTHSLAMAQKYHKRPNIDFVYARLEDIRGMFQCVLFVDVFHHIPITEHADFIRQCVRLLAPGGYLLIKDIERKRGGFSLFMDRYISGCDKVFLRNCTELAATISPFLAVEVAEVCFKFPFPHYYIKAMHERG